MGAPVLAGAQLIGTGVSMFGSMQQGKAEQAMAERNAQTIEQQAKLNMIETAENMRRGRDNNRRANSAEIATNATRGVTGASMEAVSAEARYRRELELQDLYRQADIKTKSMNDEAVMTRYGGQQSRSAGNYNAAGTLFSGLAKASSTYYDLRPK